MFYQMIYISVNFTNFIIATTFFHSLKTTNLIKLVL